MSPLGTHEHNPNATEAENQRFARFRESLEVEGLSVITCACYASDWWNVSERFRAADALFTLEHVTAERFCAYRSERRALDVAAATLNRRLVFLRRYARFAAAADPTFAGLESELSSVPFEPVKRPVARALSRAEEERLVEAASRLGPMEHSLVTLLVRTGMRPSEVVGLLRSDVMGPESAPSAVHVRGAREKTVVLPPRTSKALAAWLATSPGAPQESVFRVRTRVPLGATGAAAIVARSGRAAGVRATPRTLRHTFAVRYLAEHRNDVDGLADALGRAQPALVRAWRDEAHLESAPPHVLEWTEPSETTLVAGVSSRSLVGSPLGAVRQTHVPGFGNPIDTLESARLMFVLRGRVSVRHGTSEIEVHEGEAVSLPVGPSSLVSALGGRPAETLTVSVPPRKSQ